MSMFNLVRISPDGKQETIVAMPSQPGVPPQGFGPTSLGGIGTDPVGQCLLHRHLPWRAHRLRLSRER